MTYLPGLIEPLIENLTSKINPIAHGGSASLRPLRSHSAEFWMKMMSFSQCACLDKIPRFVSADLIQTSVAPSADHLTRDRHDIANFCELDRCVQAFVSYFVI
jgi:hypothetical protein